MEIKDFPLSEKLLSELRPK